MWHQLQAASCCWSPLKSQCSLLFSGPVLRVDVLKAEELFVSEIPRIDDGRRGSKGQGGLQT